MGGKRTCAVSAADKSLYSFSCAESERSSCCACSRSFFASSSCAKVNKCLEPQRTRSEHLSREGGDSLLVFFELDRECLCPLLCLILFFLHFFNLIIDQTWRKLQNACNGIINS